jgi:hypothetical protein
VLTRKSKAPGAVDPNWRSKIESFESTVDPIDKALSGSILGSVANEAPRRERDRPSTIEKQREFRRKKIFAGKPRFDRARNVLRAPQMTAII